MRKSKREGTPVRLLTTLFGVDEVSVRPQAPAEEQVIADLLERIGATGALADTSTTYQQIAAHECCSFAYLAPGCALIHSLVPTITELRLALAVIPGGINCCWMPEKTVQIQALFVVLTPPGEPSGYLRTRSCLKRLCTKPGFRDHICRLETPQQVWEHIDSFATELPPYVTAADIMRTKYASLPDSARLSEAIDTFCRLRVAELPIVDRDGDLVGVASEEELIHLCLPDYHTWMEDLSPILDFQPFAEILSREGNMPVAEIMLMADGYATVEEDTPAVQVAKVMMRREVRQVLVVRGNRLVGRISMHDFISDVLRA